METFLQTMQICTLFEGLSLSELEEVARTAHFSRRDFAGDEVVAFEDDECRAIGIVAYGSIHIQRLFASGKTITIETFQRGDSFGEALVFSGVGHYPATLIAREDCQVVYIARGDILELCKKYPQFLANFLRALSNKVLLLNQKIKSLSFGSLRQKVANYLVREEGKQQSSLLRLAVSRSELADSLGIPRPSLSRELVAMKEEGWIDFERREIRILDLKAIKQAVGE
jgi:CRP/FNR family transcriptional regulator, dissimilatory nitrate respiration regulator